MSLTVDSLVENPLIRTRIVAGKSGGGRVVAWAHTCELRDPWNWLGSGDLLLTDGYGFPAEPARQIEFIDNLARVGIAGLVLAEGFVAPTLSQSARDAAEERAFPVLSTERSVPFVTIARLVADSNSGRSGARLTCVLRLYDVLRRSHLRDRDAVNLLDDLAREVNAELHVIDVVRGRELMPTREPMAENLRAAVLAKVKEHAGMLPAFSRVSTKNLEALVLPVGRHDTTALVARATPADDLPDPVLAQHVAMIAEMDVERRCAKALRTRERRSALARRLVDGALAPEAAVSQLEFLGLGTGPWRVAMWEAVAREDAAGLEAELVALEVPNLYLASGDAHLLVLREDASPDALQSSLSPWPARVGLSQPVLSSTRFPDAFREAKWALEGARALQIDLSVYGTHSSHFLPRTVAEGEAAVSRLLGPIMEYDAKNDTQLLQTLKVFFEVNRSWQEGAKRLGIHKQTLAYRMKKVEELTAADLRDFGCQAELFFAIRTWSLLQLG
ncbi:MULTISPECIES: PucR family transcriptional regulator [Amycolatopsis]|uniref:Purine catabolism regulator n=1 Tax=Amycolatopsis echigonensis TaxID=2576905 RepID=A0A2N3WNP5_9PSEU|nr:MULTISPECIES: PucR family transcriptional regulator [Amycolatopsis]PKV95482.1 purine catabolism regulator [Amycolatopsis niigatensis]